MTATWQPCVVPNPVREPLVPFVIIGALNLLSAAAMALIAADVRRRRRR